MLEGAELLKAVDGVANGQQSGGRWVGFARGGPMNILIVEDEVLAATALEATLREANHRVVGSVSSAREALEIAASQPVDLALVDINLDGRRNGVELARELLVTCGVPALFLSGDGNKARTGGDVAIAYLRKPYTEQEVLTAVEVAQGIIESERRAAGQPGLELF